MEDVLVWPVLLYSSWLAIVGVAVSAVLILASLHRAHGEITSAVQHHRGPAPNKLLATVACLALYFIPSFIMFFMLFAAYTDLASALLSATVTGAFTALMLTLQRQLRIWARVNWRKPQAATVE